MLKLLIVDDEEMERTGMAQFIAWEKYGIRLMGTAKNGAEALPVIEEIRPEIVLTDIKMPVMNGIDLIREAIQISPQTVFVVLSGYGEYEFTSQAMELGVRYYLLKPFNEKKIVEVLGKIKIELSLRREANNQRQEQEHLVSRLIPYARDAVFRAMLQGRADQMTDYKVLKDELKINDEPVAVVICRMKRDFENYEKYAIENMLLDLLTGQRLLLTTELAGWIVILIQTLTPQELEPPLRRLQEEFKQFESIPMQIGVSECGTYDNARAIYEQVRLAFRLEPEIRADIVFCGRNGSVSRGIGRFFELDRLYKADSFSELLFEFRLSLVKLELAHCPAENNAGILMAAANALLSDNDSLHSAYIRVEGKASPWDSLICIAELAGRERGWAEPNQGGATLDQRMLEELYRGIDDPHMDLRYLSQEVFFMNKDYLGRLFNRTFKQKFTTYLENARIEMAKRLLTELPDIRIQDLAESVGYPADAQYFSRVFKQKTGKTPAQYK